MRLWWAQVNETGAVPLAIFDEAVEMGNPSTFPVTGPYVGHDGIETWARETWEIFDDDLHHELTEVVGSEDGATVVSVQRIQGTLRHSGLPWDVEWAGVWRFRDRRAYDVQGFLTPREAMEAAGLGGG